MEPKSPQFSAYDFLGYLLPGLVLIGLIDCSWLFHSQKTVLTWELMISRYATLSWDNAIPLALLGYFLGHMVSFASSILVEDHATRMHGHPACFLVRHVTIRYFFSGKFEKPRRLNVICKVALKGVVLLFVMPIWWVEYIFSSWLGLSRQLNAPINPMLRMCIKAAEDRLLTALDVKTPRGKRPTRRNDELHWGNGLEKLALHYALEMAPAHLFTLRNYVVLYGFLRAMTLILLVVLWMAAGHLFLKGCLLHGLIVLLLGGIAICPCYGAYLKFWTRYHREALMAFLAASVKGPNKKSDAD